MSVCQCVMARIVVVVLLDIWNEGLLLDDDNDDVDRVSVSSHSEVAQLEDIADHHASRAAEGADGILLRIFASVSAYQVYKRNVC